MAKAFDEAGYHKQVVNRLLEPFLHITVLVSATEWVNFLELRDHKDAEPHIQMLAREIRKCLGDESTVQMLKPGEWHLPFITEDDRIAVEDTKGASEALKALSVARCASTSYKTVEGFDMTIDRAQAIFDKLVTSKPCHASPLEHVAQADWIKASNPHRATAWQNEDDHRNFVGFRQYRAMVTA
jgi:thymidylate synthase ThyX